MRSRPDKVWTEVGYALWSNGFDPKELAPNMTERQEEKLAARISASKIKSAKK